MDEALQRAGFPPSPLCGRVGFDLVDGLGRRAASIVLSVRVDHVDVFLGEERHLACLEREALPEWLGRPDVPLEEDEVVLFVDAGLMCMSFARSAGYVVPDDVVRLLVSEV